MPDRFEDFADTKRDPGDDIFEIMPDDDADLPQVTRGICFGTAGALKVTTNAGNTVTIPSGLLSAGQIHPLRIVKVFATGTTAANIWGVV